LVRLPIQFDGEFRPGHFKNGGGAYWRNKSEINMGKAKYFPENLKGGNDYQGEAFRWFWQILLFVKVSLTLKGRSDILPGSLPELKRYDVSIQGEKT